ncbi:Choline-sulfatase [Gimesia maris]|uniref:sulfatase-like hydrolase/transferase n=1 Tax=Gimesia maris TaxID=122 RepID=UPI0011890689|nr:sulfatase-like hydrolase/transferase [Gimesia maris]QDU14492.1 Choline-sulfatase [Gimesia maris]
MYLKSALALLLATVLLLGLPELQAVEKQQAAKPNIVIILCDDLGYGDLACYGHPVIKTPHLDQLASEGMRLTDCYASAPVCSPSRAGLLTGRTPNRLGVYDWIPEGHPMHLKRDEVTVAQLLQQAGYDTAHVGKWHCNGMFNSKEQPQPGDHGFRHWFSTQNNALPTHENPNNFVRNGKPLGEIEGFSCQIVANEGIRWLSDWREKEKPFFLHVCFHEPHERVASPPALVETYLDKSLYEDQAQYFANVANMDRAVGKLLKKLDEMKVADNTLVFFTSDNGPETLNRYGKGSRRSWGSPGVLRGMKLHIYEGGIRVPGIVRWPGKIKAGQESATPVCSVDLLPTFCEIAGVAVPDQRPLDGASLLPLFAGNKIERTTPLFWNYYRAYSTPRVAMREGDWKVVAHWSGPEGIIPLGGNVNSVSQEIIKNAKLTKFELYNLKDDISEQHNLAWQEQKRLDKLKKKLVQKYAAVQKEGPVWDTSEYDQSRKKPMIKKTSK